MNFEQKKLISQVSELMENQFKMQNEIEDLLKENKILRKKVQALLKRMFGKKSEKINANQLELLLGFAAEPESSSEEDEPLEPPLPPRPGRKPVKSKPRLPEDLPVETVIIEPDEVKADPQSYKCIGEEVTEELDVIPQKYIRRRIVRRKYKSLTNKNLPPVVAPLVPRIIEGGYATAGLLTDIILKKYEDHLPLYRQEQILRRRYGIELSRKTMCDWVKVTADWLKPIYNQMKVLLKQSRYLQIDETPVKYPDKSGGSGLGYFWAYNDPYGDIIYEWHTSRAADCLQDILHEFSGVVQSDGYNAYTSYAKKNDKIELAGCWAHARRKFVEATDEEPELAGWFLNQIGLLYHIETVLRKKSAGFALRCAIRESDSKMVLNRIKKALDIKLTSVLPQSNIGKAVHYALRYWRQLEVYTLHGRVEIDNNQVENKIRPIALGKKNWLHIGHAEAGERSAIIYSILLSCKKHGINTQEYLYDVLSRLPSMKITEIAQLIPENWNAARKKLAA